MRKSMRRMISIMLILFLLIPSLVVAETNIDIDYVQKGNDVIINISGNRNRPVSITIKDNFRYHYINQDITDDLGKAEFRATLDADKTYDCKINIDGETAEKKIFIKETDISPSPSPRPKPKPSEPGVAYIYIKGYKGVILPKTEVKIKKRDSVLDLTKRILDSEGIDYNIRGGYVAGIDGQEEFDRGSESGWMFSVNGRFPDVGAGSVDVRDRDFIKWLYTQDLGEDVGCSMRGTRKEEKQDAISVIEDEKATEKDVVKVIKDLTEDFSKSVEKVKDKNGAKRVLKDLSDVNDVLLKGLRRLKTEEGFEKVAKESLEVGKNATKLLDYVKDRDSVKEVCSKTSENNGISLVLINKMKNKKTVAKITEDMLNESVKLSEKVSQRADENKKVERKFSAWVLQDNEDIVEFNLSNILLKKSIEKDISKLDLSSNILDISLALNSLDSTTIEQGITIKGEKLKKSNVPELVRGKIPEDSTIMNIVATRDKEDVTKFKKPIKVGLTFKGKYQDKDGISAFFVDGETVKSMGGIYDSDDKKVTFFTDHFSKYFAKENLKTFKDTDKHWAKKQISILAGKGVVNGRDKNSFQPNANITRAEFTALITRMLGYNNEFSGSISFEDVNKTQWFYEPVAIAYSNGLVNGKSSQKFDPNGKITRQEMTKIISNILKDKFNEVKNLGSLKKFADHGNIAPWAKDAVALSLRENVINGISEDKFAPKENATRAQAVVILYRLYNLLLKSEV